MRVQQDRQERGRLYIVGTPLGNLEDITLRALRILGEVDLIAAEDTRVSRKLLARHRINTPLISFHRHSTSGHLERLVGELAAGKRMALVTDAGMPGISDPGEALVAAALREGIDVIPIPGPSAVVTALAVSGLCSREFTFVGFLPRSGAARRRALEALARETRTVIIFEAPHRLADTLDDLRALLGERRAAVARELTKKFEEVRRGTLSELSDHFVGTPPRGEFTLVIEGASPGSPEVPARPAEDPLALAVAEAEGLVKQGVTLRDASRQTAVAGVSRRALYNALLERQRTG